MFVVGWGANQFAPLLIVYRQQSHIPESEVTAMFGAYALGLIPALLIASSMADRLGRRRIIRPVLILSIIASAVLILGSTATWALFVGRLLAGAASGAAFGPGSAWIKELSENAPKGAGARRAAIALSAGFGGGPLVAGLLAQWLPQPEVVPYLVHIALVVIIAPLAWVAPETVVRAPTKERTSRHELYTTLGHRDFLRRVVPVAPWAFITATTSFAVLPAFLNLGSLSIAESGAVAGMTLGAGIVVQPFGRRLEQQKVGLSRTVGLTTTAMGFVLAAVTVVTNLLILLVPTAVILGGAYGLLLVAGLTTTEGLARPQDLATASGVFYCLTYLGFAAPYLDSALVHFIPAAALFLITAGVALLLLPVTLFNAKLHVKAQ